ncbi:MAG: hypothetical protein FWE36_06160 [Erysipelotrichales bacterium]|nr:hypothetical protein [Erysipelotrichales bacterium]
MTWQPRGDFQLRFNANNLNEYSLDVPENVTWTVFSPITEQMAGRYTLSGQFMYGHWGSAREGNIVLAITGTKNDGLQHEVYYKQIELLGRADTNFFNISITDIEIHHGLNYEITITASNQRQTIIFRNINLQRTKDLFFHATDFGGLAKLGVTNTSRRLEIIEFSNEDRATLTERIIPPVMKEGVLYFSQGRKYFGDRNMNHPLADSNYLIPETRYILSESIGQPRKGRINNHVFTYDRENDVYTFTLHHQRRPIFIREGIYNNRGELDSNGYWDIRVNNNGQRVIRVTIAPTINISKIVDQQGRLNVLLPIAVFKDLALNQSIGQAEISLEYHYLPIGVND